MLLRVPMGIGLLPCMATMTCRAVGMAPFLMATALAHAHQSHASGGPGRHHWRCRLGSGDSRQGNFERLAVLWDVHRSGIKPQSQSLFGIGYGFLLGIACTRAPRQVREHGRPTPGLRVIIQQQSELHSQIIPPANLPDNLNPAHAVRLAASGIRSRKAHQQVSRLGQPGFQHLGRRRLVPEWLLSPFPLSSTAEERGMTIWNG